MDILAGLQMPKKIKIRDALQIWSDEILGGHFHHLSI